MSIISDAINRLLRNEQRMHEIVNGDAEKVVETDNGPLPSLAKLIHDNQETIDEFLPAVSGKEDKTAKDAENGYAGLGEGFQLRLKNMAGTVVSYLTAAATQSRSWGMPDKDGVVALVDDIPDVSKEALLEILEIDDIANPATLESLGAQANLGFDPVNSLLADQPNGFPVLDENGRLDSKYFPDSTESVLEYPSLEEFPEVGLSKKIYVDLSTNLSYRWDEDHYQELGSSVGDSDTIVEGQNNLYFKIERVLTTTLQGFNLVSNGFILGNDTIVTAFGKAQRQINTLLALFDNAAPKLNPTFTGTVLVPDADTTIDSEKAVNSRQLNSRVATISTLLNQRESIANKAISFATIDDLKYPTTQAVAAYVNSRLISVITDCGNWDASGNVFPNLGGTGPDGTVMKGNLWFVSVPGILAGKAVEKGDTFRALEDFPAQDANKWDVLETNLGYVPLNNAGGIMYGPVTMQHTTPTIGFNETDQAGALGAYRVIGENGSLRFDVNTAALRDFSTYKTAATIDSNGRWYMNGGLVIAGPAALGPTQNGTFSYEGTVYRFYIGDGTGYSWAFSKRIGSVTTDLVTITDNGIMAVNIPLSAVPANSLINGTATNIKGQSVDPSVNALGGVVNINGGDSSSTGAGNAGGAVVIKGGKAGSGTGAGGRGGGVTLTGGDAGVGPAVGGNVTISGGAGATATAAGWSQGGNVIISGGATQSTTGGGIVSVTSGQSVGGKSGTISFSTYNPNGNQGNISFNAGYGGANNGTINFVTQIAQVMGPAGFKRSLMLSSQPVSDGVGRWGMSVSAEPETGSNNGSNFGLDRYSDAGALVDTPLSFSRASGIGSFLFSPLVPKPAAGDSSLKSAPTSWVRDEIAAIPYDIGGGFSGKPTASEVSLVLFAIRKVTIPLNMAVSKIFINTAPTASYVVSLTKNGVQFATFTVAAGASSASLVNATADVVVINPGDIIRAVAPATVDATASDITFAIAATIG